MDLKNSNQSDQKKKKWIVFELLKTSRGRGILFFGFYFVFFLIIICIVRFAPRGTMNGINYEKGNSKQFSIQQILNQNYQFQYHISWDQKKILYQGVKYNQQEMFSKTEELLTVDFYRDQDQFLKNVEQLWIKADNPYYFFEFIDEKNISDLLDQASYLSKTVYESGKTTYQLQISTSTLVQLFFQQNVDLDDVPNEIMLSVDSNGEVFEINFSLDSYCKYLQQCKDTLKIKLTYDQFGKIEKITNPLN